MSYRVFPLDGGVDGDNLSTGNTGANQVVPGTGGTAKYSSTYPYSGTVGAKMTAGANAQCLARFLPNNSSATMSMGVPFVVPAAPATTGTPTWVATLRGSAVACRFQWTNLNAMQLVDAAGANVLTIASNLTPSGLYWLSSGVIVGTSTTGTVLAEIYDWQSNLVGTLTTGATYNIGTANITGGDFGIVNSNPAAGTVVYFDQPQFNDGSSKGIRPPQAFTSSVGLPAAAALATKGTVLFRSTPALQAAASLTAAGATQFAAVPALTAAASMDATGMQASSAAPALTPSAALAASGATTVTGSASLTASAALSASAAAAFAAPAALAAESATSAVGAAAHASEPAFTVPVLLTLQSTQPLTVDVGLYASVTLSPVGKLSTITPATVTAAAALSVEGEAAPQANPSTTVSPVLAVGTSAAHSTTLLLEAETELTAEAFTEMFGLAELRAMVSLTVANTIEREKVDLAVGLSSSRWDSGLNTARHDGGLSADRWAGGLA